VNCKSSSQSSKLRISLAGFKGNGLFIRGDDATNVNTAWPWSKCKKIIIKAQFRVGNTWKHRLGGIEN